VLLYILYNLYIYGILRFIVILFLFIYLDVLLRMFYILLGFLGLGLNLFRYDYIVI